MPCLDPCLELCLSSKCPVELAVTCVLVLVLMVRMSGVTGVYDINIDSEDEVYRVSSPLPWSGLGGIPTRANYCRLVRNGSLFIRSFVTQSNLHQIE